jgi:nucleoside phosphorylase
MENGLATGIVVMCAKPDELEIVQGLFSPHFAPIKNRGSEFTEYLLPASGSGTEEKLILCNCADMGNTFAAAATGYFIGTRQPNLMLFLGTAGSLRPNKCKPGDVVIPSACDTRYYDRICEKDSNDFRELTSRADFREYFFGSGDGGYLNALNHRSAQAELTLAAGKYRTTYLSNRRAKVTKKLQQFPTGDTPAQIHSDARIFSWDMIIDSAAYRDFLVPLLDRKVCAVDMESFGFLKTIDTFAKRQTDKTTNGLVIRGISDNSTAKASEFDQKTAMTNAAIVAVDLIQNTYTAL